MKGFIKDHWFGLLISAMIGFYLIVFTIGIISPQFFEGCTIELSKDLEKCSQGFFCISKSFIKHLMCEIKIIL